MAERSGRLPISPQSTEMMPTRPRNIAVAMAILDRSDSWSVMPSDMPTVVIAEKHSKATAPAGSSGCISMIAPEYMTIARIEKQITALARRTDERAIDRPKTDTPFCPQTIDLRFSIITAKVLILIPPPIDCDEHPIHISIIAIRNVTPSQSPGAEVAKPAVRTVAEQKIDCTMRLLVGRPDMELLYSNK